MNGRARWWLVAAAPLLVGFSPLSWIDPAAGENHAGNQRYTNGQFEDAAGHYSKGNAASPGRPELLYNLGNALERLGKHDEAAAAYQQALEGAGPGLAGNAWYNLGNSLLAGGKAKQAVQAYREALVREPANERAKRNLELALEQAKKEPPQKKPGPNGKDPNQDDERDEQQQQQPPSSSPDPSSDSKQQPGSESNPDRNRQQGSSPKPEPKDEHPPEQQPSPQAGEEKMAADQPPPPPQPSPKNDDAEMSREQAEGLLRSFEQMERRQLQEAHPDKGPGEALGRRDW